MCIFHKKLQIDISSLKMMGVELLLNEHVNVTMQLGTCIHFYFSDKNASNICKLCLLSYNRVKLEIL